MRAAEAIFGQLLRQVAELRPAPVFFANLGDFAGPGTRDRHQQYVGVAEALPMPNLCLVGNHDLDDPAGWQAFEEVHGSVNYSFARAETRFVAIHAQPRPVGTVGMRIDRGAGLAGPREEDLSFLDKTLADAEERQRVVLMHMPPHLGGHYAPHDDWGFRPLEAKFLALLRRHGVSLVCCAHGLAFDTYVYERTRFVMSGGGGTGLCSHFRGVCTAGRGTPEARGALFHATKITLSDDGGVSLRLLQAFSDVPRHLELGG